MFPSSALHTDFARQLQHDRRIDVAIARRTRREDRGLAVLAAALLGRSHRTVPAPAEVERPAVG